MQAEQQKQHQWLRKLLGEWTFEAVAESGPDKPEEKSQGTESVRSLGPLWVVCEGRGNMPGGGEGQTMMTVGFDPDKDRFVGTWVGSVMSQLWVYEGELDSAERELTLNTEGPKFDGSGGKAKYRDVIEFLSDDHRTLTSHVQSDDGEWSSFMTAHYRRR